MESGVIFKSILALSPQITQNDLAGRLGVTKPSLNRYCKSEKWPYKVSTQKLVGACEAYLASVYSYDEARMIRDLLGKLGEYGVDVTEYLNIRSIDNLLTQMIADNGGKAAPVPAEPTPEPHFEGTEFDGFLMTSFLPELCFALTCDDDIRFDYLDVEDLCRRANFDDANKDKLLRDHHMSYLGDSHLANGVLRKDERGYSLSNVKERDELCWNYLVSNWNILLPEDCNDFKLSDEPDKKFEGLGLNALETAFYSTARDEENPLSKDNFTLLNRLTENMQRCVNADFLAQYIIGLSRGFIDKTHNRLSEKVKVCSLFLTSLDNVYHYYLDCAGDDFLASRYNRNLFFNCSTILAEAFRHQGKVNDACYRKSIEVSERCMKETVLKQFTEPAENNIAKCVLYEYMSKAKRLLEADTVTQAELDEVFDLFRSGYGKLKASAEASYLSRNLLAFINYTPDPITREVKRRCGLGEPDCKAAFVHYCAAIQLAIDRKEQNTYAMLQCALMLAKGEVSARYDSEILRSGISTIWGTISHDPKLVSDCVSDALRWESACLSNAIVRSLTREQQNTAVALYIRGLNCMTFGGEVSCEEDCDYHERAEDCFYRSRIPIANILAHTYMDFAPSTPQRTTRSDMGVSEAAAKKAADNLCARIKEHWTAALEPLEIDAYHSYYAIHEASELLRSYSGKSFMGDIPRLVSSIDRKCWEKEREISRRFSGAGIK